MDLMQHKRPLQANSNDSCVIADTSRVYMGQGYIPHKRNLLASDVERLNTILLIAPVLVFSLTAQLTTGIENVYDGLCILRLLSRELHELVTSHIAGLYLFHISRGFTPLTVPRSIIVTYVLRHMWRRQFPNARIPFLALSRFDRMRRVSIDNVYHGARAGNAHLAVVVQRLEEGPKLVKQPESNMPHWARCF